MMPNRNRESLLIAHKQRLDGLSADFLAALTPLLYAALADVRLASAVLAAAAEIREKTGHGHVTIVLADSRVVYLDTTVKRKIERE